MSSGFVWRSLSPDSPQPLATTNSSSIALLSVPGQEHPQAFAIERDESVDDDEVLIVVVPPSFPLATMASPNGAAGTSINRSRGARLLQIVKDQIKLAQRFMGLRSPQRIAAVVVTKSDDGDFKPQLVLTHRQLHRMFCDATRAYLKQHAPTVDEDYILFRNNGLSTNRFLFNLPDNIASFRIIADNMVFDSFAEPRPRDIVPDIFQGLFFKTIPFCALAICFASVYVYIIGSPFYPAYQQAVKATALWIHPLLVATAFFIRYLHVLVITAVGYLKGLQE